MIYHVYVNDSTEKKFAYCKSDHAVSHLMPYERLNINMTEPYQPISRTIYM